MGFNIKNNYGPNIEVNEGGVVNLHQTGRARWEVDAEEAEYNGRVYNDVNVVRVNL